MPSNASNHTGNPAHQTVTEFIRLKTPEQSIQIAFTDQKVSGRTELLSFAGVLHWHTFGQLLAGVLPHTKSRGIPVSIMPTRVGFRRYGRAADAVCPASDAAGCTIQRSVPA